MALIVFGIGFGLLIGFGLFGLMIYPAIKERRQEQSEHSDEQ
jgi:hypothetical protein